jgi:hypothetical protein
VTATTSRDIRIKAGSQHLAKSIDGSERNDPLPSGGNESSKELNRVLRSPQDVSELSTVWPVKPPQTSTFAVPPVTDSPPGLVFRRRIRFMIGLQLFMIQLFILDSESPCGFIMTAPTTDALMHAQQSYRVKPQAWHQTTLRWKLFSAIYTYNQQARTKGRTPRKTSVNCLANAPPTVPGVHRHPNAVVLGLFLLPADDGRTLLSPCLSWGAF